MGKLGFKFDCKLIKNNNLSINDIKIDSNFIVIFIERKNLKGNHIIGLEHFFKKEESKFLYLTKELNFSKFLFLEDSNYKYAKVSVTNKTILDFEFNTIWLNPKSYKEVYALLEINDIKIDLKQRMNKILEII